MKFSTLDKSDGKNSPIFQKQKITTNPKSPIDFPEIPDEFLNYAENNEPTYLNSSSPSNRGTNKVKVLKTIGELTVEDEARNLSKNNAMQSNVVKVDMRKPIKVIYLPQNSKSLHENIPVTENKRTFIDFDSVLEKMKKVSDDEKKNSNIVDIVHRVKFDYDVDMESVKIKSKTDAGYTVVRLKIPKSLSDLEEIKEVMFAHLFKLEGK